MFLLGGILLAMVLSAGAVFVAEYLDPSFRTPEEVQQYLSIPLLAALPKSAGQTPNALAQ
jgi:capsular polysaccharide biosynthesis protein